MLIGLLLIIFVLLFVLIGGAYYAYRIAFFSPKEGRDTAPPITGEGYESYRGEMRRLYQQLQERPYERVTITSWDGLTLSGKYYHASGGAPLDIAFHGYRSTSARDFSGGAQLSFQLGHNLLLVDQRAHGRSEGSTIAFGITERQDVLSWAEYAIDRFGPEVKIILYGLSMGAATVLMSSALRLPGNVKGIIADCPYASPLEIILHVGRTHPIPQWLMKPFVILAARLFGHFDLLEIDAATAVKFSKVPILIMHGEGDTFVPCEMSLGIQLSNPHMVRRYTFPNAEHGISMLVDHNRYCRIASAFMDEVL